MDHDTDLGGSAVVFPATQGFVVRSINSDDAAIRSTAHATLISTYWKPIYKYIRIHWHASNEDAKDLTQTFLTVTLQKNFFAAYDPAQARFRTFVRLCVDNFLAKERRSAGRLKRGGSAELLSLDFTGADGELQRQEPVAPDNLDDFFRQEWLRGVFGVAVEDLRHQCDTAGKLIYFTLFERYDLEGPEATAGLTYAQLGAEFGLATTQITNYLAAARRWFRQCLLERLRASTGSEEEYQHELRRLFGDDPP